jgi:hypothetical protein
MLMLSKLTERSWKHPTPTRAKSRILRAGIRFLRECLKSQLGSLLPGSLILGAFLLAGCVGPRQELARNFDFQKDTFSFSNELVWIYQYDEKGKWTTSRREPKPTYYQHCFVLARSALQFFKNARFDPNQPEADDATYGRLISKVVSSNPRCSLPEGKKITIPGYSNLRTFSQAHEKLLKAKCGGAWQSYFQRGHWRILFPFSRAHQQRTAEQLVSDLSNNGAIVVHVVRFPELTINHAIVLFGAKDNAEQIEFLVYDPNSPAEPAKLLYNRETRTFIFGPNNYFPGDRVDVYEVYHKWNY